MQGLTTGKSYSFAWRFGNEKGVQETLSRFSPAVTLRAATVPEPPSNVHIKVVDDALLVRWHMKESGGRPVLKFNVRVSGASGRVLFEKTAYRDFIAFHHVPQRDDLQVAVSAMTALGLSAWSQPYVFASSRTGVRRDSPLGPRIALQAVEAHDTTAMVHLNLTAPGNVVCSVYSASIRPAFTERRVNHAGHARVFIAGLSQGAAYEVSCSLSAASATGATGATGAAVTSNTLSFTTQHHADAHVSITEVEAFATFARVHVKSEVPGTVMCFPHRKHFGDVSAHAFRRFAKTVFVGARGGREA